MTDFQIEFVYNDVLYAGLVRPFGSGFVPGFAVVLESELEEFLLEIFIEPSSSELEQWDFRCGEGEDAGHYFDKDLLEAIGEQIQARIESKITLSYAN